jgi:hypothetical protein
VRQYRTLKWLKGGRQAPSSQGSINRAEAIRAWAIQAQEQLKERWAQITHEDHEMVSRLEIRLPNGLILAVEGDPDRSWRQKPEPESIMMAKLRAAISTTEWAAVTALYGKAPASVQAPLAQESPLDLAMAQAQAQAATPRKPRVAQPPGQAAVSPGQALLGGLMGNSPQPA